MPFRTNKSFRAVIDDLGLSAGLQLCLDAGDIQSYNGTSQLWLNRASDYNFFKGDSAAIEATDPTFNGTAGGLSENEYFSFVFGDFFTAVDSNPEWVSSIHKNNAKFTIVCWLYQNNPLLNRGISGTNGNSAAAGYLFMVTNTDKIKFFTTDGVGVDLTITSTDSIKAGWNFLAISADEQSNSATFQINDIQESFAFTYPTPTANNPAFRHQLAAVGGDQLPLETGDRMGGVMMWNRSLSDLELMNLYQHPSVVFSDLGGHRMQTIMQGY